MMQNRQYCVSLFAKLLAACLSLIAPGASTFAPGAQPPPGSAVPVPRLFTVSPAGGRAGTSVEITWTGIDTEEPQGFYFSHPGFKAEPIVPPAPPTDPKKPATAPAASPAISKFRVVIASDVPAGIYDIRLVNKWGISNPRAFAVGDLPETAEKEPNDDVPQAQRIGINSVVNGVIASPTDVDYFVFAGKKDQRVLIHCLTAGIDSRLLAGLEVFDSAGKRLAFSRYTPDRDPLIDLAVPRDGDYYLRLTDFTHTQGSAEHFYRLKIATTPWIDAVSPLAVEPGKKATLTVYGRNLPGGQPDVAAVEDGRVLDRASVQVDVPGDSADRHRLSFSERIAPFRGALDGFEVRLKNGVGVSNPFLVSFAKAPTLSMASKTASTTRAPGVPPDAREIAAPCELSGTIEKQRSRDCYVFAARKNDVYTVELSGERLGARGDLFFILRNAATGQDIAELDDNGEVLHSLKFYTWSSDPPTYRFSAPDDGKYLLLVSSRTAATNAGPRHYYRLRITPENPDFRLIVLPCDDTRPDGFCLRQGGNEAYTVLVWRQDGFTGPVALSVLGLPSWVNCPPQVVGPNLKQTALVLSAAANAPLITGDIKIQGTAVIKGQMVVREARPASITWPIPPGLAFPAIGRLDRSLVMAVRENAAFNLSATPEQSLVVQGTKVNVGLKLHRLWPEFNTPIQVGPVDPGNAFPSNLVFNTNNQPITMNPGKDTGVAVLDVAANVLPGTYNLVLQGTAQVPFNKDSAAKQKQPINVVLPATPIALTVLPRQVASLAVSNPNTTLKIGAISELTVKVTRSNDYTGPFKVQVILPPGMSDIGADEVAIPQGKDEAKVILRAPANAVPGNRKDLIVRAIAVLDGNIWLTHESKFNVNVVR
jgi:hypothetical protein